MYGSDSTSDVSSGSSDMSSKVAIFASDPSSTRQDKELHSGGKGFVSLFDCVSPTTLGTAVLKVFLLLVLLNS